MFAVIRDGGRQLTVREGDRILVSKRAAAAGEQVRFEDVLLVGDEKGAKIGTPNVAGAAVVAKVVGAAKGEKLVVFKYRRRAGGKTKKGHRQLYTAVRVEKIEG